MKPYGTIVKTLAQSSTTSNTIVGCEVGVCKGLLAKYMLHQMQNLIWIMVDRWKAYPSEHPDNEPKFQGYFQQGTMDAWRRQAREDTDFADVMDRRIIMQCDSMIASRLLVKSIDIVFIDAAHDYENVKRDLQWWDNVKDGGIMCGHDYRRRTGVPKAVDEWLEQNSRQFMQPIAYGVWAVRKEIT